MKLTKFSKLIIVIYSIAVIFWLLFVYYSGYQTTLEGSVFEKILKPFLVCMTILPMIGGIISIHNSLKWGGWESYLGKSAIGLGLGLIAWSGGMVVWNYYLFFTTVEVPYPSIADAVFILSWPLWSFGLLQMSKVVRANLKIKNNSDKYHLFIIPFIIIAASIYLLFGVARGWGITWEGSMLKLFFDLFYPIGDIVILTITSMVYFGSRKYLGGMYKMPIIILFFGFVVNYFSDFLFSYTTTKGTYFNGHIVDFIFTTSMFIIALGAAQLTPDTMELD